MADISSDRSHALGEKDLAVALDRVLDKLQALVFSKTVSVAELYFLALMMAGVGFFKSFVIAIGAGLLLYKAIAPNLVLRTGPVLFVLAAIDWTGLLPIGRWISALIAMVDRALT